MHYSWHKKHQQRKLYVMHTASVSEVFALFDGRINTTSASCKVYVLGTSRSRMQQPKCKYHKDKVWLIVPLYKLQLVAASCSY